MTLTMCVNYGGRAEIADAVRAIAEQVADGRIKPSKVDEKLIGAFPGRARHARRRPVPKVLR